MQVPIALKGTVLANVVLDRGDTPVGVEIYTPMRDMTWNTTMRLLLGATPTDEDLRELGRAVWIGVTA